MKQKSIEEVADIVESEGLGYAVQHYLSYTDIKEPDIALYWKQAKEALDKIQAALKPFIEPDEEER